MNDQEFPGFLRYRDKFAWAIKLSSPFNVIVQIMLWMFYGFMWIPALYLLSGGLIVVISGIFRGTGAGIKAFFNAMPVGTCPMCKKNWMKEVEGQTVTNRTRDLRTVTRTDRHTVKGQMGRQEIGQTERREQVVVEFTFYTEHCKCKGCGYKWNEQKQSAIEV